MILRSGGRIDSGLTPSLRSGHWLRIMDGRRDDFLTACLETPRTVGGWTGRRGDLNGASGDAPHCRGRGGFGSVGDFR